MKRLTYNKETFDLLLEIADKKFHYWRYQDSKHGGKIPVGHQSYERMFEGEEPECIEEGCSCYDNPWQLVDYMSDECLDLDKTDVVIFTGQYVGYGIDDEDIVIIEEESDILYSLSLRDFYKFILDVPSDLYWNTYNVKEVFCDLTEEFKVEVME